MHWRQYDEMVPKIASALADARVNRRAQEEKETKEELRDNAIDHAKTYWMLGWTWDEIEAILEDMEFPDSIIGAAVKEAQLYAADTLKDGPYHSYKYGQLVKMKSGKFAKVVGQTQDGIALADIETGETYLATEDLLYKKRSAKLTEAFALRRTASDLRKIVAIDAELVETEQKLPEQSPPEPKITEKQDFLMTPKLRRPSPPPKPGGRGWEHDYPEEYYDVEEASQELGTWMTLLESLQSDVNELRKQKKEIEDRQKAEIAPLKEEEQLMTDDIKEAKDTIISILSTEENVLDQLDEPVFKRFEGLLVGLHKTITSVPILLGPTDEAKLEARLLMQSINAILPKTKVNKILEYLDSLKKLHTITEEIMETKALMYKAPVETKKSSILKQAGVWDKIKSWFKHALGIVQKQSDNILDDVIPAFDEASDLIEEFLSGMQAKTANSKIDRIFR